MRVPVRTSALTAAAPAHSIRAMSNVVDVLASVPLLSGLDRRQLERLGRDFSERTFPAGSTVVREGDQRGLGFFVIADGEAVTTVDGRDVAHLGPGSYFGEVALISDRVRTATVTAVTGLHCYVMTVWDFRAFVQGDADVAWKLLVHLAELLHGHASSAGAATMPPNDRAADPA
jgi:voltage-gated potassium channel